jgi:hypothetical protein
VADNPKVPKRHSLVANPDTLVHAGHRGAAGAINDDPIAALVGRLVAAFVHLEDQMAILLAELSGADDATAGYMLRALTGPAARVRLIRSLLQKSPRNKERGEEWDLALKEFERINTARNEYVHGHWWTSTDDGSVWLAKADEHGLSVFAALPVDTDHLEATIRDIGSLLVALPALARRPESDG